MTDDTDWIIDFRGSRSGQWPATVSQVGVLDWSGRGENGAIFTLGVSLGAGITRGRLERVLGEMLSRHESLRTVFRLRPDGSVDQLILAEGTAAVGVLDELAELGLEADRRLAAALDQNPQDSLPVQFVVGLRDGQPVSLAIALSHVVADLAAGVIVLREIQQRLTSSAQLPDVSPWRPVEQAQHERQPRWQKGLERTLDYWRRTLAAGPFCALPAFRHPGPAEHWSATFVSLEAGEALSSLSARSGVAPSVALLGTFLEVFRTWSGQPGMLVYSTSANRHMPELAEYVGTIAQETVIHHTGLPGETLYAALARLRVDLLLAYAYGHFDVPRMTEVIDGLQLQRGAVRHRDIIVNDLSGGDMFDGNLPGIGTARPVAAKDRDVIEVSPGPDSTDPFRITVLGVRPRVRLALIADRRIISHDELTGLFNGFAALLRTAAGQDLPLSAVPQVSGVQPVQRRNALLTGRGWLDLGTLAELIAEHSGSRLVRAFDTVDDGLTACLAAPVGRPVEAQQLRSRLLAATYDRHELAAPSRFLVADCEPSESDSRANWATAPVQKEM